MAAPIVNRLSCCMRKSCATRPSNIHLNYSFGKSPISTLSSRPSYPRLYQIGVNRDLYRHSNIALRPALLGHTNLSIQPSVKKSSKSGNENTKRSGSVAWTAGLVGGVIGLFAIYKNTSDSTKLLADDGGANSASRLKYKPNRKIRSDSDNTGLKLTLYQYQTCPFCTKVRAYLDYRGFSYDVIEVNSVRRNQIKWSKYKKVPILVCQTGSELEVLQLNDSSVIISALESHLLDRSQTVKKLVDYYPELQTENSRGKTVYEYPNKYFLMHGKESAMTESRKEEQTWRQWSDDVLVHALSPNIYLTPSQSLEAFKSFSVAGEWEKAFNVVERWFIIVVGAAAMYFVGKILKRRYNLKDDVRESLYDACSSWTDAVKKRGTFLGGHEPNLADLAIYGELNAIEGCQAFRDLKERNPSIAAWYSATKKAIAAKAGRRTL